MHDIEAFVALLAEDYDSQQPAHPDRAFRGRDQVRANWSAVFARVPDLRADLVATAVEGDCVCRLYVEPVEQEGEGIQAAVRGISGRRQFAIYSQARPGASRRSKRRSASARAVSDSRRWTPSS